jgi:hypothetical protein
MTDRIQQTFAFHNLGGRKVGADFKGGNGSADGWVLLLREVDRRTGLIDQLAACFTDQRRADLIEHTVPELNPRFIETNVPEDHALREPERLHREFHCARGDAESKRSGDRLPQAARRASAASQNRIKEQQPDFFADRISREVMGANQLRLWFSTFAYLLRIDLREAGLEGNVPYARASPGIVRTHLLKIAAVVTVSVRRVLVRWSSRFRFQAEVAECRRNWQAAPA